MKHLFLSIEWSLISPKFVSEFFELTHQPQPPAPSPDYVDPTSLVGKKRVQKQSKTH